MKKAIHALAFLIGLLIVTAPSPPLISVTGTVYDDNGAPAPGTSVTFSSISTQVTGGVEVPPTSFSAIADPTGAISVNLPQGLRVNVVVGKGAPMAVTLPNQSSIDLSALLAAVQVPPPADLVSSLSVASGGDYALSVSNPTGAGSAVLTPGNVTRINGNPVAALVPNPGQFLAEDAGGIAWEPFSLSGDVTSSVAVPGQLAVNHFTLGSNASAGGFKLQNLAAPGAAGDALSEGNPIGSITPAAGTFTSLTASGTSGPALSNFNVNGDFNVKAYGAKGDASTDDAAAIQAAINAACAVTSSNSSAATVVFPPATYRHTGPLQVPCSNITLAGAGRSSSTLAPAFAWGPAIMVVGSGYTGLETSSSLVSGAGSAMLFDGTRYWLNLRDSAALDVNGLSAFTVEAFVNPTSTSDGQIITSSGRFLVSSQPTQAFSLQMVSSQLEGRLTLGGTTYIVDSGSSNTLSVNNVYHVAMSWDGSTIRIFINGTLVNSHAATGTLQQATTEDVTLGPSVYDWPDGTLLGNAIQGSVDSVRLSNVARYTVNFTPPSSKFSADSNTLGLLNFDQVQGPLVGMYTNNGLAWLPVRRTNEPSGTSEIANNTATLNNVAIRDLGINAGFGQNGIFATVTLNSAFDRLWINGTRNGLYLWNNCYQNAGHNVTINSAGTGTLARIGLANIGQSGINEFDHLRVSGGPFPLVGYEGSMLLNMLDVAQQSNTIYGAFFKAVGDSTITLNAPILDVEAGGTTWLGGMVFSSIGSAVVNGGELDSTNSAPAAIVDGGGSISFISNRMNLSGTPPAAIHVLNAPLQQIAVIEPATLGLGSAPVSDLASGTVALTANSLSNVSVNGVFNVRAFGATGSGVGESATTVAGSAKITLNFPGDFSNGQSVVIPHAGPTPSVTTPTGLAVTTKSSDSTGSITVSGCSALNGVTCSTAWTYQVYAVDANNGWSAATTPVTIATGASALSGWNINELTFNTVPNAVAYPIYGCSGTSCTPTLRGVALPTWAVHNDTTGSPPTSITYDDFGLTFGSEANLGTGLPAGPLNQNLVTTILSGAGTISVTLASPATASVTYLMHHNDAPAFQAAVNAACAQLGGTVQVQPGEYHWANTVSLTNCEGAVIRGDINQGGGLEDDRIAWNGPLGGTAILLDNAQDVRIENLCFAPLGSAATSAGVGIDIDAISSGPETPGHITVDRCRFINQAVAIRVANQQQNSLENNIFTNNDVEAGYYGLYLNSIESINNYLAGNNFPTLAYGIYDAGGDFQAYSTNFGSNITNVYLNYLDAPVLIHGGSTEHESRALVITGNYDSHHFYPSVTYESMRQFAPTLTYDGSATNNVGFV
ncbi:MAG: LamG-like jellyroll fold domain-containing protein, partial [Candidatus Binataceae bacterium]